MWTIVQHHNAWLDSIAGHPKNLIYIDSGASLHILFNKELLGELNNIEVPIKIQAGGKPFHIKQIGSLHQALRHLPLPVSAYHYSETAIANLLSFAKLADEYYIICNTRIDNETYVQSKDDGKYLQLQRDPKHIYITLTSAKLNWTNTVISTP